MASFLDALNPFKKPQALPGLPSLPGVGDITSQALGGFLQQQQYIPGYEATASNLNTAYQRDLSNVLPSLLPSLQTSGGQAQQLLGGNLPADVQAAVRRSGALASINGGFGANSGMARNLTARDFGLTSLNLINQGQNLLNQDTNIARSINPNQASQFMINPSQFLGIGENNTIANNNIAGQNAAIGYSNDTRKSPFDSFLSNLPNLAVQGGLAYLTGGASAFGGGGPLSSILGGGGSSQSAFNSTYDIPSYNTQQPSQLDTFGGLNYGG